jgi:TPR repeat protein
VDGGLDLLKTSAKKGYVRASYALGLVLRDSKPDEAMKYMQRAANTGYIPALQEVLPAREMKAKHGEPSADKLRRYLDPMCLNRLLSRHYVRAADVRDLSTSHCWNPLCGRWAHKANSTPPSTGRRGRRSWGFSFNRQGHSATDQTRPVDASSAHSNAVSPNGSSNCSTQTDLRMSRMKMCSRCCRAKYCSKLCQVYDWRSGRHKMECQFL